MKTHPGNYFALALTVLALNLFVIQSVEAAFWVANSLMITPRQNHTATLLPDGKVLVAGGATNGSAEVYDPATGMSVATGTMNVARSWHTATLLPNGKVLVVGGWSNGAGWLASAELYDPVTGRWTVTGSLHTPRLGHTMTLLPNGKVLVAAGTYLLGGSLASAELYDPASGVWTVTGTLSNNRYGHTATLLANGKVLVAGGLRGTYPGAELSSAELYDPVSGTWSLTGSLNFARENHTATRLADGRVLATGGDNFSGSSALSSTELYDPSNGTWTAVNSLNTARHYHTMTLLPDGKVLITGGLGLNNNDLASTELYDPASGTWTTNAAMNIARSQHLATLLANGKLLVTGGASGGMATNSTEVIEYASGTWMNAGLLNTARDYHTATLLPNGKILIAGGGGGLSSAELYSPTDGTWTNAGTLSAGRGGHTATLLPAGKVLITGGFNNFGNTLASSELYNPTNGTWIFTGAMNTARAYHTATLLPNGKVLVAGGGNDSGFLSSAELYDPASGTWKSTTAMTTNRQNHTATLLANGKVLVAGGRYGAHTNFGTLANGELFDPASETWTATGMLFTPRAYHTATLLPNGKVLVVGGDDMASTSPTGSAGMDLSSAELYDPISGTWTNTGSMSTFRDRHTANLLPDGKVLVSSGDRYLYSAELYDPAVGRWTLTGLMTAARQYQTATLLPNGKVLVAGGIYPGGGYPYSSTELFNVGLGYTNSWQPQIAAVTSPLNLGTSLVVTGSQFRGVSGSSSGNSQDSSTDYPLVQLRRLDNEQTMFLLTTNWSTNTFTSLPVWNFPSGYALATVFVNGIQSTSSIVNISVPVPAATILVDPQKLTNGFRFAFTNSVGALFGVLATTNASLPLTDWTVLDGVMEISPGQFQFTDPQATNDEQRFYRAYAP